MKNNPVCKENASNVFRKEREQYHEIQDLKAQMQDKNMVINELKKLILVTKGKSVETQFDKPSVVRQPNAQRIPKPTSVLKNRLLFQNSPKNEKSLPQNRNQAIRNTNVLKPGMFRIASTTAQNRTPQLPHASRNTNPHMSKSSGVIHSTSVSRPQLKSYQVKEKVVPNISQVKFTKKEVEDQHLDFCISKKNVCNCRIRTNSSYSLLTLDAQSTGRANLKLLWNFVAEISGKRVLILKNHFAPVAGWKQIECLRCSAEGSLDSRSPEKSLPSKESFCMAIKASSKSLKSTSGGIQFLGDKLVSWMSKKQNCTAMSSAEAEYVALSASCAQVMWMRTQLQDYGFQTQ
ncbi:hypothetical protein Tco_0409071 [Tanacetum coccineum]